MSRLGLGLGLSKGRAFSPFDPLSLNPILAFEASRSMMAPLASESLDLDPANPSTLDVITATRAGTATYTDASGNIQTASSNTVRVDHPQGEQLTPTKYQRVGYTDFSSGWSDFNLTIVDGEGFSGQVSKVLTAVGSNAYYAHNIDTLDGVNYHGGFWIRRISGSGTLRIRHVYSESNTETGAVTVGSEWVFVSADFLGKSGGGFVQFGIKMTSSGDSVEIAMPQVEEGTTASDFVENTTGSPKYFAAATYAPRVPMILVEPAATNLITYSEDFSESLYVKDSGVMIGTTNHVSPAGSQDATKIEVTDSGRIYTNLTSATYATSLYLKSGTFSHFKIAGNNLDLQSQTFAGGTIEFVGDGWYRISYTYTGTRPFQVQAYPDANYSTHTDSGDYYIWGAQVETGTVATSFIPTSGSAVTRAADDLVIDGSDFTNFYNTVEGTFYVEAVMNSDSDGSQNWILGSQSSSARFLYQHSSANQLKSFDGTSVVGSFTSTTKGELFRYALTFDATTRSVSYNGETTINGSHNGNYGSVPTALFIGSQNAFNHAKVSIKRLIYWPYHSDNL